MAGRKSKYTDALVADIVALLEKGNTDGDTCGLVGISKETFYQWIKAKPEFADRVSHARSVARDLAVATWRSGMEPSTQTIETEETFSETRLDRKGKPYQYTRTVSKRQVINHPPDWKAAEAYLKRRDPLNWSEHQTADITSGGEPIQLNVVYESPKPKADDEL